MPFLPSYQFRDRLFKNRLAPVHLLPISLVIIVLHVVPQIPDQEVQRLGQFLFLPGLAWFCEL
jgi:hypothetical protein